ASGRFHRTIAQETRRSAPDSHRAPRWLHHRFPPASVTRRGGVASLSRTCSHARETGIEKKNCLPEGSVPNPNPTLRQSVVKQCGDDPFSQSSTRARTRASSPDEPFAIVSCARETRQGRAFLAHAHTRA